MLLSSAEDGILPWEVVNIENTWSHENQKPITDTQRFGGPPEPGVTG